MCGIAGSLRWDGIDDREMIGRMTRAILHRGPDAGGIMALGGAVLGHRRLSIIDTAIGANQPMRLDEAGLAIVFNGEIYNFRDIRAELEACGHVFRTHSDTEVLLHAFARWGRDCLERLVGMFAFALWDERRKVLTLARDRLGKKPLFLVQSPGGVAFASELKALRLHPFVAGAVNPVAVGQFLSLGYVLGDACILEGVEKLAPGEAMEVSATGSRRWTYWNLAAHYRAERFRGDRHEASEQLGALIDQAVADRMVSDVPLGAFLSGGIDSAVIVESMRRAKTGGEVETFTIGFGERGYSEVPQAEDSARAIGVGNHAQLVDGDMARLLPDMVRAADEPFADTSMIPLWFLSEFARRSVTVCLSGDGGDEAFGGYVTYAADRIHRLTGWVPDLATRAALALIERFVPATHGKVSWDYKARQFLANHALPFERAHYSWRTLFEGAAKAALVRADRRDAVMAVDPFAGFARHFRAVEGCHYIDQAMYVDIKTWLPDDILVKVDRMTMAHALEARAPLLDHRVVEFAARLPVEWKLAGLKTKRILKDVARRRLPAAVTERRKAGFNAPVAHWLKGELAGLAHEATLDGPLTDWCDRAVVERLWSEHEARRADHGFRLFALTCLGLWLRQEVGA